MTFRTKKKGKNINHSLFAKAKLLLPTNVNPQSFFSVILNVHLQYKNFSFLGFVDYRFSAKTLDQNMYRHTINGYMSTITSSKTIKSKKFRTCGTKTKIISLKIEL